MNQKEAREYGFNNGSDAVKYAEVYADTDQAEVNCQCITTGDPACEDCLTHAAYEAEQNARQYAGFSAMAYEINQLPEHRMESTWEAYERGVTAGIKHGLNRRLQQIKSAKGSKS